MYSSSPFSSLEIVWTVSPADLATLRIYWVYSVSFTGVPCVIYGSSNIFGSLQSGRSAGSCASGFWNFGVTRKLSTDCIRVVSQTFRNCLGHIDFEKGRIEFMANRAAETQSFSHPFVGITANETNVLIRVLSIIQFNTLESTIADTINILDKIDINCGGRSLRTCFL